MQLKVTDRISETSLTRFSVNKTFKNNCFLPSGYHVFYLGGIGHVVFFPPCDSGTVQDCGIFSLSREEMSKAFHCKSF